MIGQSDGSLRKTTVNEKVASRVLSTRKARNTESRYVAPTILKYCFTSLFNIAREKVSYSTIEF